MASQTSQESVSAHARRIMNIPLAYQRKMLHKPQLRASYAKYKSKRKFPPREALAMALKEVFSGAVTEQITLGNPFEWMATETNIRLVEALLSGSDVLPGDGPVSKVPAVGILQMNLREMSGSDAARLLALEQEGKNDEGKARQHVVQMLMDHIQKHMALAEENRPKASAEERDELLAESSPAVEPVATVVDEVKRKALLEG